MNVLYCKANLYKYIHNSIQKTSKYSEVMKINLISIFLIKMWLKNKSSFGVRVLRAAKMFWFFISMAIYIKHKNTVMFRC